MNEKPVQKLEEYSVLGKRRPPTRISERFLSTITQGVWAEGKAIEAINKYHQLRAVKYGQSRADIFDKNEFLKYWEKLEEQIKKYGKRPDILIFKEEDIPSDIEDISEKEEEEVKGLVNKAIAGLECRSSTWYLKRYREVKGMIKDLSITIKAEDIEILRKWRTTHSNAKLYYIQIFFDSAFALSFDKVLNTIEQGKKNFDFSLRTEKKTGKKTFFIPVHRGLEFAECVQEPRIELKEITTRDGEVLAIKEPVEGEYVLSEKFVKDLFLP